MSDRIVQSQWGLYTIHLMRRSHCFVLDNFVELPDSYCVKTKAYSYALYVYMSAQPLPIGGFRYGYRLYKSNTFTLKTTLFGWKSMILRSDLTLLNINMSKNSTFAWFFLLKSLYYQWLLVSLHRQFPPSLSTMLKCVGLFCLYTFTIKILTTHSARPSMV